MLVSPMWIKLCGEDSTIGHSRIYFTCIWILHNIVLILNLIYLMHFCLQYNLFTHVPELLSQVAKLLYK